MTRTLVLLLLPFFVNCQNKGSLLNTNFYQELPFEVIRDKILVPVTIQGETYKFILDSGGKLDISKRLQDKFNFEKLGTMKVSGVNGISITIDKVKIPLVQLGDLKFQDYPAMVSGFTDKYPGECLEADGMIGRDFLKDLILHMDMTNKQVILTDQAAKIPANVAATEPLKMYYEGGLPYITLRMNQKVKVKTCIDTGSPKVFSFKTKSVEQLKKKKGIDKKNIYTIHSKASMGISAQAPKASDAYIVYVDSLRIGSARFDTFYTDITLKSRSRVGSGLLKYGTLTMDFISDKFYFTPYDSHPKVLRRSSPGIQFSVDKNNITIAGLYELDTIKKSKIKMDDVVEAINGVEYLNLSDSELCTMYQNPLDWNTMPSEISFKIRSKDGTVRTVMLPKLPY
ncbi:MAG: retropepsin-like aspartic protease [Saprospiraceae bacterium]